MTDSLHGQRGVDAIPVCAGIGLREPHYQEIVEQTPTIGWLEAHPENYFGDGGPPLYYLEKCRENYPLSLHGVGLSLGSADQLSERHLQQLKCLIDRFEPGLVSEHLSWGSIDGQYFNDLLPLPYTEESLAHFCDRIEQAQDYLGRTILIENPSSYLSFSHSTIPEYEYLIEASRRTGCGLLIDVTNIYISAHNLGFDAYHYIEQIPAARVGEIHLAGYAINNYDNGNILIDDHGAEVSEDVWKLYGFAINRLGPKPSLLEWDNKIPPLTTVIAEAIKAQHILDRRDALVA